MDNQANDTFCHLLATKGVMKQGNLLGTMEISEAKEASLLMDDNAFSVQPDGLRFNEWQAILRERQRYQTVVGLHTQCKSCAAEKQWELGVRLATYWLEMDPLNEKPLQYLMNFLANNGRPQDALRQYERYRWWLLSELTVEPEPRSKMIAQTIAFEADIPFPL